MPFPPPVLPINRTDSLDQQANHPADHNAVNQAVNDTVTAVQAVAAEQVNHATAIGQIKNPSWINGDPHLDGSTGFRVGAGSTSVTTNANGDFLIVFPGTLFTSPPTVTVTIADSTTPNLLVTIVGADAASFSGHAIFANTDTAIPAANTTTRVNWIAFAAK